MSRIDGKLLTIAGVVAVTLLQAGAAAVMFFGRRSAEGMLVAEADRVAALALQLTDAKQRHDAAPPAAVCKWHLLETADVSGTLQIVQSLGDAAGVEFGNVKAVTSNTAGRQAFAITGHGTPSQVCQLLAAIEQNARLIVVESGKVVPESEDRIAFELGLATYHLGERQ